MYSSTGRNDGLFRAVIAESGFGGALPRYAGGFNATTAMQATYDGLVSNTSCAGTVGTAASLDCLRALPFAELNAALNGTTASPWPPVLDGDFIADYPTNQLEQGNFPKIPILIGANSDEGSAFGIGRGPNGLVDTDEDMAWAIEQWIGPDAPANTGKSIAELVSEALFVYPNIQAVGDPGLDKFPVIVAGDAVATSIGLQYRRSGAFFGDM
jgi:acetylcholinesterase